jgi:hypothetical protein
MLERQTKNKMGTTNYGRFSHGRKLRRNFGKAAINGEAWMLEDPHEVSMFKEDWMVYSSKYSWLESNY